MVVADLIIRSARLATLQVHTDVYPQFYQYQAGDLIQTAGIHPLKLAEETQFVVHNLGTNSGGWWWCLHMQIS